MSPLFYRLQRTSDGTTSLATWHRSGPVRRFVEDDDDTGGDRLLFDPIDDRDRQCHSHRSRW
jgi:hypothetical protein